MANLRYGVGILLLALIIFAACGEESNDAGTDAVDPPETTVTTTQSQAAAGSDTATSTQTPEEASTAADATPTPESESNADLAPALGSIDNWYNAEPLSLEQLRGQSVLLVFWADI